MSQRDVNIVWRRRYSASLEKNYDERDIRDGA